MARDKIYFKDLSFWNKVGVMSGLIAFWWTLIWIILLFVFALIPG